MAADEQPDLFLFGGDLTSETFGGGIGSARRMIDLMAGIGPPLGSYACLGNHDMTAQSGDGILAHYASSSVRAERRSGSSWIPRRARSSLGGLEYCGSGYEDAAPPRFLNSPRPRIPATTRPVCLPR